jgi:hypothetical protein
VQLAANRIIQSAISALLTADSDAKLHIEAVEPDKLQVYSGWDC